MTNFATLTPVKRALLERRLQGRFGPGDSRSIPRRVSNGPIPLSLQQYRLWFLDQFSPGRAFANIDVAIRLDFPLDVSVLRRCLNEIVRRHEALRTTFQERSGDPVQIVAPSLQIEVPVVDLSHLDEKSGEARALAIATEEARRPFNLTIGPLIRAKVLRLGPARWVLVLTVHHIVADGWSMRVFFDEMATLYASGSERPFSLPELPVQFPDYAVWQREHLAGELLSNQVDYWRKQLAEMPTLELPIDRPRPSVQTFAGAGYSFTLSADLVQALREIGNRAGATPFMTLLTGFAILLARYSEQDDIPIGTYIAGRTHAELERLIGFFVNTLILRIDLSGDLTFDEALRRVRSVAVDAYANQDVPFEKLVEVLAPPRDQSRNPLVQVAFQLFSAPARDGHLTGSRELEALAVERGTANFDLACSLANTLDGGLRGSIEYNTSLYHPATVKRFVDHYQRVLAEVAGNPERSLTSLELLGPAEREWLAQRNATAVSLPQTGLAEMFAAQVAKTPNAPAVIGDHATALRFGELDRRANRLAHRLIELGVGPEVLVGVYLERSADWVTAAVAIAKSGGAYLALEPSYPSERLTFMLQDSGARVLITRHDLASTAPKSTAQTLCIDDPELACQPGSDPCVRPGLHRLGYVVYTSGSTGRPKGVAVEERQIVNRLTWMWREYPFAPEEISALRTPSSFVDSLWELWGPLLAGVPSVVVPDRLRADVEELIALLSCHKITRLWLVPSILRAMLDTEPALGLKLPSIAMWVVSGEPLTANLAERFFKAVPSGNLYNLYGISEVWDATWHLCAPGAEIVHIGKPISNVECFVLDRLMRPVPIGVAGELCVGGMGLARGYLGLPELTAERFVEDPNCPGRRIYRTGDRVRWSVHGALEFLGRVDNQVKIRGVRVELAEVEAAISDLEGVDETAVAVWPDPDKGARLAAYVVPADGAMPTLTALRRHLSARLPDPMIPSSLTLLAQFPQTPSGKLDRRALPPPSQFVQSSDVVYGPSNPLESILADIWGEVLRLELGWPRRQLLRIGRTLASRDTDSFPSPFNFRYQSSAPDLF